MSESKEDRWGPIVLALVVGLFLGAIIASFVAPNEEAIREELVEEIRSEMYAERTLRENEIMLENLEWAIKRLDGEMEEVWDRIDIADLLEKNREEFMEDLD